MKRRKVFPFTNRSALMLVMLVQERVMQRDFCWICIFLFNLNFWASLFCMAGPADNFREWSSLFIHWLTKLHSLPSPSMTDWRLAQPAAAHDQATSSGSSEHWWIADGMTEDGEEEEGVKVLTSYFLLPPLPLITLSPPKSSLFASFVSYFPSKTLFRNLPGASGILFHFWQRVHKCATGHAVCEQRDAFERSRGSIYITDGKRNEWRGVTHFLFLWLSFPFPSALICPHDLGAHETDPLVPQEISRSWTTA